MIEKDKKLRQRYQIIESLKTGGICETYLAEDLSTPTEPKLRCFVKRLKPDQEESKVMRERFEKEAKLLNLLSQKHQQFPKLYDYFEEGKKSYIVQEFIDGEDFRDIISDKQLSETEVIEFLVELLELLAFIHQESEIHGDIKPDNIMRRKQDSALILVDIMGKVSGDIPSGTFGYMPHEQWDWNAKCSNATYCSEVYSAGITAIEALTGICPRKLPKDTETQELNWRDRVEVRDELADILNKMVRCDSNQRYQSASEVLQDLKKLA